MEKLIKIIPIALVILITVPVVLILHYKVFTVQNVEEIPVEFSDGKNQLHGILTLPGRQGSWPAVVLLHGSSRGTEAAYEEYARELVKAGYAILRYDSPGKGLSTGSTFGETFESRVEEALSAIEFLESRNDIKDGKVGLWGISQGGWICQLASAQSEKVAFIIPVSGPGVSVPEQEAFRVEAESRAAGFSETDVRKAVLVRRLLLDEILSVPLYQDLNEKDAQKLGEGPWNELLTMVYSSIPVEAEQELKSLIRILKSVHQEPWSAYIGTQGVLPMLQSLPPEAFASVIKQMEASLLFHPSEYLAQIKVPVLAIFGSDDTSLPVEKSISIYREALLEAGNMDLTVEVFQGADHQIRVNESAAPGYYTTMTEWLMKLELPRGVA
jgi:dienelactone hydrolase